MTATLSVVALLGAIIWNISSAQNANTLVALRDTSLQNQIATTTRVLATSATTSSDLGSISPISMDIMAQVLSAYASNVAKNGVYEPTSGVQAAIDIGKNLSPKVSYQTYALGDVKTDPDTSTNRMLSYRADLRVALEPLFDIKHLELETFAHYVETGNAAYLNELHADAVSYRAAASNVAKVIAPSDAAVYQAAILNALNEFAATLDAMSDNAQDPLASAALLKTYTNAESSLRISFDSLGAYAAHKMI
jgi:hypothetical protein